MFGGKKEEADSDDDKVYNREFREELARLKKEYGNLERSESEPEELTRKKPEVTESDSSDDYQFTVMSSGDEK